MSQIVPVYTHCPACLGVYTYRDKWDGGINMKWRYSLRLSYLLTVIYEIDNSSGCPACPRHIHMGTVDFEYPDKEKYYLS